MKGGCCTPCLVTAVHYTHQKPRTLVRAHSLLHRPPTSRRDVERVQKISPQSCCDSLIVLWCLDNSHLFGFFLRANYYPPSIAITRRIRIRNFDGPSCPATHPPRQSQPCSKVPIIVARRSGSPLAFSMLRPKSN